jgi:hypothetical protein
MTNEWTIPILKCSSYLGERRLEKCPEASKKVVFFAPMYGKVCA